MVRRPDHGRAADPRRHGVAQRLRRGCSYSWSGTTGARFTRGAIRALYAKLGFEQSFLGFPKADEASARPLPVR